MLQKADVAGVLAEEARRAQRQRITTIGVGVAVVAAVVIAGGLWWFNAVQAPAESFVTDAVTLGDVHVTLVATGTLQPVQQVGVSSTVSGTIASVDVDYNESVSKGQTLAHLDMRDLEARLTRSLAMIDVQQASVLSAKASLADAAAALARTEALSGGDAVSQRDLELARTAVQRAEANVAAAAAQLKAAEADLDSTRNDHSKGLIVSPIDGMVLDFDVEPGQSIAAASLGQPLFTIVADLKQLDLEVEIDEADVAGVTEGDHATFTVEASPDKPFTGIIRQIRSAPSVSDGVVSYKALVAVDNTALLLKPGMTATADIAIDDAIGVLTVPNAALRYTPVATESGGGGLFGSMAPKSSVESTSDQRTVWALADGKAQAMQVTVGLTDGQRTEIRDGALTEGDLVITGSKAR